MPSNEDKPASFIVKLCNILRSKENAKIIYWDTELKGIRILNQKKLQEVILPRYYRHNRVSSFVRQLNMYDFHKVHLADHRSIFLHTEFDPKKKDQIHLIRRKVNCESKTNSDRDPSQIEENLESKQNGTVYNAFFKSNKNYQFSRLSNQILSDRANFISQLSRSQALRQLSEKLESIKGQKEELEQKIKDLKKEKKYRSFLKLSDFLQELYKNLGLDWQEQQDVLSELSIEDELVYKTRRSFAPRSLKLVESGQLYFRRDTIGNLWNI